MAQTKKTSLIYCRVSSIGQTAYNKSISLQAQEQICLKFAHENKLCVKSIHKEIHSVFHKTAPVFNNILQNNHKNCNILISSVDRYSRSVDIGLKLAIKAFKNKNTLIFIQEKFVCGSTNDLVTLKAFLKNTEQESKIISNRVKTAKQYLINNGMFSGGAVPYGYDVVERKLVENVNEQRIIEFIKTCMKDMVACNDLNKKMLLLSTISPHVPINCYDKSGNKIDYITEPLTSKEISDLLNSYTILKRGTRWCPRLIKTALKYYDLKADLGNAKLTDWDNVFKEINDIEIKVDCDNLGLKFDIKNTQSNSTTILNSKTLLRSKQPIKTNYDRVKICDDKLTTDIDLFKKFVEFQKFNNNFKK
jgi:DNA invertase Pin-like site-specific DNA recombinase